MTVQAGLCLTWSQTHIDGLLMPRLILYSMCNRYKCDSCSYATNENRLLQKHTSVVHSGKELLRSLDYSTGQPLYNAIFNLGSMETDHVLQKHTSVVHSGKELLRSLDYSTGQPHYNTIFNLGSMETDHVLQKHLSVVHSGKELLRSLDYSTGQPHYNAIFWVNGN